jgi:DNA ligase-1
MALPKREFVLLAHHYNPDKHVINGWYISEKLDGQRALWLPETRGSSVVDIPFANRAKDAREHTASGLWTRSAKPIFAPGWWLDQLPLVPLDGELYTGRGDFSSLRSYVSKLQPIDAEWHKVRYHLFDAPAYREIYRDGRIWTLHYKTEFAGLHPVDLPVVPNDHNFANAGELFDYLLDVCQDAEHIVVHPQEQLPFDTNRCMARVDDVYGKIISNGGEGVVLRKYTTSWEPIRSHGLLKIKPTLDDEGTIIGYTWGDGKLEGLIGALILRWKGKEFKLSGFTEQERFILPSIVRKSPGTTVYVHDTKERFSPLFSFGQTITFEYRELTKDGIPKEARYKRPREDGE